MGDGESLDSPTSILTSDELSAELTLAMLPSRSPSSSVGTTLDDIIIASPGLALSGEFPIMSTGLQEECGVCGEAGRGGLEKGGDA